MLKPLCTVLALGFGGTASAVEWETIFKAGDWRLDVNIYDSGAMDCEARSSISNNVVASFYELQNGNFQIAFQNDNWNFPESSIPTKFVVKVDYRTPWDMSGTRSHTSISIYPDDAEDLARFLNEVRNGRRLIISNDRSLEIANFSLSGSAQVLAELATCADRIRQNNSSDPFGSTAATQADPFR